MGYQPIWDAEFDVCLADNGSQHAELLEAIFRHKLILTSYVHIGSGAGNPAITLRGTQRQFLGWLADYYLADAAETPETYWEMMKSEGFAKCIA